jgi:hypothetical protein
MFRFETLSFITTDMDRFNAFASEKSLDGLVCTYICTYFDPIVNPHAPIERGEALGFLLNDLFFSFGGKGRKVERGSGRMLDQGDDLADGSSCEHDGQKSFLATTQGLGWGCLELPCSSCHPGGQED